MEKKHEPQIGGQAAVADLAGTAKSDVDMALLNQVMEAFNSATVKLQSSYELLQEEARKLREEIEDKNRELSDISNLLETVINNTRSSILVIDGGGRVILKNRAGEKLSSELGEDAIVRMLSYPDSEGVFDYEGSGDKYFRLSVGHLANDTISGTVFVIDDITNIKRFEFEKQRGEKLQLMGEMVANIAHEIRNPLGSMELFASLLERDLVEADQKRLTTNIVKAVRTINRTISNTLLFAKEMQIKKETYYLSDIVDDVILYLQHTLKEKKAAIINQLNESHTVNCDKDLFRQVVMNLVHNSLDAVKEEKGEIVISSRHEESFLYFCVKDNGCGLPAEMRTKLFMPFQTTKAKGTGLGLSIIYKIVKAHAGDIIVDSDGQSYTSFTVKMPS